MAETAFDPRYGQAVTVAPGIVRVTADNAGPFTGAGTNSYVVGQSALMVVDPGPQRPDHIAALVRVIGGRPVSHILLTHTHRDHVDGVRALVDEVGGQTIAEGPHRLCRPLKAGETNPFETSADYAFAPDMVAHDGDIFTNGDATVRIIATPGHTANHVCVAVDGSLLSGDHVMGWSTTVVAPPDGDMGAYLRSLDRLLEERFTQYFPGHGERIAEPARAVSAMKTHRLMREAKILERVAAGDRALAEIVDALYAGLDQRLRHAAKLSVLAHLEKLEVDGAVVSEGAGPASRWRPR